MVLTKILKVANEFSDQEDAELILLKIYALLLFGFMNILNVCEVL